MHKTPKMKTSHKLVHSDEGSWLASLFAIPLAETTKGWSLWETTKCWSLWNESLAWVSWCIAKTQELEVNASTERSPWSLLIHTQTFKHNIEHHQDILGVFSLDERYVVPLQHDPAELLLSVPLGVHLRGVVQHQVHVLIKSRDVTLNPADWTMASRVVNDHTGQYLVLTFS